MQTPQVGEQHSTCVYTHTQMKMAMAAATCLLATKAWEVCAAQGEATQQTTACLCLHKHSRAFLRHSVQPSSQQKMLR